MSETVKVYGYSDDLIEVEGAVREEFDASGDGPYYLAFSDGTMLSVKYDRDGMWRIHQIHHGGAAYEKQEGTNPDDDYSDVVTLTADRFDFVLCGEHKAQRG